jgi:ActR/RegA family two-component response regulator
MTETERTGGAEGAARGAEVGKVLIVDDDKPFLEAYEDVLTAQGYWVQCTATRTEAIRRLDEPGWSVVIIDQKLQGPTGPDSGLDLLAEARVRAPGAKAILATAYASKEAVERAFREGAYDYLEKSPVFPSLLRVKVRNAFEAVRERWLSSLDPGETERVILSTWAAAQVERDKNKKGALLEQLVNLLLKSVPGMRRLWTRVRNEIEEIDLLVQNDSTDPFWQKESPYLLVECKNWSGRVGTKEVRDLWAKMEGHHKRCRLALFVAAGGFAESLRTLQATQAHDERMVILIGPNDLDELVRSRDRNAFLKELHRRAAFPGDPAEGGAPA